MKPISETLHAMLVRQGIANSRAATHASRGKTASSRAALSFMERANALLDREGDERHSLTGGEKRRMGISGKVPSPKARPVNREVSQQSARETTLKNPEQSGTSDPSPVHVRPVLRLVSSRQSARTNARKPCLVLIEGGRL